MSRVSIRTHLTNELQKAKPAAAASSTSGGGTNLLTVPPHPHHGADHTGALPISDLTTSETDVTKVLGPDGLGGIEVRPEATISVSDGSTVVDPVSAMVFSGAVVTDAGGGIADVAVTGGSAGGGTIFVGFDGGGSPLTTATQDIYIRSARTITGWELIADQAGSCTVDVLQGTMADLIAGSPPVASLGSVALGGVVAATGSLSGSLAAADVVRFVLSAVDGLQTKATLTLVTT